MEHRIFGWMLFIAAICMSVGFCVVFWESDYREAVLAECGVIAVFGIALDWQGAQRVKRRQREAARRRQLARPGEIIPCPDCQERVSSRAVACPRCGCPIAPISQPIQSQGAGHGISAGTEIGRGVWIGCGMFILLPIIILIGWAIVVMVLGGF